MDAIEPILDYVAAADPTGLPAAVVESTKQFLIDTLTLTIVGRRAPGCAAVAEHARTMGGAQATILSLGVKVAAPYAALANGMAAHAFDYDDLHEGSDVHGFAVIVPAALAMAEREGRVSGPSLLAAVAIGVDVANRMGLAIREYRGWHATATCGVLGASLAAGFLAKLDRATLHNAVGIAYSMAAGTYQPIADGALSKRLQAGLAARGGVEAVMLAQRGITGAKNVLQGRFGYFPLYERNEYDPAPLTKDLGRHFEVLGTSMKPYPSCRFCHGAAEAALQLRAEAGFDASDVQAITISVPSEVHALVGGPYRPGPSPQVNAQFSIVYNVCAAIVHGALGLREFDPNAVLNCKVRQLADRSETVDNGDSWRFGKQTVSIVLNNGTTLERTIWTMKGHPANPMSRRELLDKAHQCMQYGEFSPAVADRVAAWAEALDREDDALTALMPLVVEISESCDAPRVRRAD